MNAEQLAQKILKIPYPKEQNQHYFEFSSADGFAFLGAAKAILGLDCETDRVAVADRKYSLNHWSYINDVKMGADNQYVYTLWTCAELYRLVDISQVRVISDHVEKVIGRYPNGFQRYCLEEPFLVVPNATSAAALLYALTGKDDRALELVIVLKRHQKYGPDSGNWDYMEIGRGYDRDRNPGGFKVVAKPRVEDCYHVGMMVCHLREAAKVSDSRELADECAGVVNRALKWLAREEDRCGLCHKSEGWFCEGSVGWGVPMLTMAISGRNDGYLMQLEREGIEKTVIYLDHANFRVRAMSAWALARIIKGNKKDD